MSTNTPIRNISDTALWVAMYRALESERPDALFKDPYARRMAGERGEAILHSLPRGRALAWPMIVRTAVMDEIILRCIREGAKTVLNLAAGLDARPFRLELPRSLRWLDVDLPDMIQYRREHLEGAKASCVHEHLAADLSDADERGRIFERVSAADGPALTITEGLLIYLTDEQAGALSQQLSQNSQLRWWLIDLASPQLLQRVTKTWQPHLSAGNAPMRFAPPNGAAFFAPFGWREAEFRSTWDESIRLRRSIPMARLWNLLLKLRSTASRESARRMSGIVLLERI